MPETSVGCPWVGQKMREMKNKSGKSIEIYPLPISTKKNMSCLNGCKSTLYASLILWSIPRNHDFLRLGKKFLCIVTFVERGLAAHKD
jgi:hypothetical protein